MATPSIPFLATGENRRRPATRILWTASVLAVPVALGFSALYPPALAAPRVTKLVPQPGGFQLLRDGQPYFIKGVGGSGPKPFLKEVGGNSFRTWGSDNLDSQLDEAERLGLTVTVGMWLGHTEHGFSYANEKAVQEQLERCKAAILRYKDHPAVLMWGIGNEMEGYKGETDPKMWAAVQEIAAFAHRVDPNHPTMTVIAEIGGDRVPSIHKYCPDVDVVGINSYGGGPSLPERYKKLGGTKPYCVTEFGPPGTWEIPKTEWGAAHELTSTAKGAAYRTTWQKAIKNQPLALGGYAFTWGFKQEATATWFGMLLPDGSHLEAVDALSEEWTGKPRANRVPQITSLKLEGPEKVSPGSLVKVQLEANDPEKAPLKVKWLVQYDPASYNVGGETEVAPSTFPDAIVAQDEKSMTVKLPPYGGGYRLFAYVQDGAGGSAVANVPLFVEGGAQAPPPPAPKGQLPLEIYGESPGEHPYIPSGYMGNYGAIHMNGDWRENPRSGKSCLKVDYTASSNWGGVVWQSPANDWGEKAGGLNLTGATKITFWARGQEGGEVVNFSYGLIGRDKKFFDTGRGELPRVQLTQEWKQYSIPLQGQDLTRIKSGFCWTAGAQGKPFTFYLDDIRYE